MITKMLPTVETRILVGTDDDIIRYDIEVMVTFPNGKQTVMVMTEHQYQEKEEDE